MIVVDWPKLLVRSVVLKLWVTTPYGVFLLMLEGRETTSLLYLIILKEGSSKHLPGQKGKFPKHLPDQKGYHLNIYPVKRGIVLTSARSKGGRLNICQVKRESPKHLPGQKEDRLSICQVKLGIILTSARSKGGRLNVCQGKWGVA